MKILGLGTDIVECARIEAAIARQGEAFVRRVFTDAEALYCARMKNPMPHYAARFAAKEAVSKAFGTGIGAVRLLEVEVVREESGRPLVTLHGDTAALAKTMGITEVQLSLSHTEQYAVATAIAVGPAD